MQKLKNEIQKRQLEICRELAKGKTLYSATLKDDLIVVAIDDFMGYVFKKDDIIFNIDKTENSEIMQRSLSENKECKELSLTHQIFEVKKRILTKLKCCDFEVFVDKKSLEMFGDCKILASSPYEYIKLIKGEELVGYILPLKYKEEF